ncbi:MAG: ATP-binding cassette domain-containing protein [Planctomycetes bacterium]|nr:ATP-binding cassette domain-containing protein [Planctomycetota bacterium]
MSGAAGLLALEDVTCGYAPGAPLLRGVTLDVQRGEVAAVVSLDASGGKSTLVKVAAGLLPPASGGVRFDGQDVYAMRYGDDLRFRSRCAVVLEGGALLVNMSVRDNVALPLRYHRGLAGRELDVQVARLLELAGFSEDAGRFPWQVSVRGRRLAAFARALALDPELVIVDRFFEGLEMPDWKRLFELVLELNTGEGVTWLLVSETDPAIFQVAERVAVLEGGRVLDYGHRRQLYQDPRVKAAFEACVGEARGARQSGRVGAAAADSERIVVAGSDDELMALASGSDPGALDAEATLVLEGVAPPPAPPRPRPAVDLARTSLDIPTPPLDAETTIVLDGVVPAAPPPPRPARRPDLARTSLEVPVGPLAGEETIMIDGVMPRLDPEEEEEAP